MVKAPVATPVLPPYEALPYAPLAHAHTHPARLAAIARAAGVAAAPAETARVLELGCAAGWNLIPMAARLPRARFFGIDLDPAAIAHGQVAAAELGIDNLQLAAGDIMELGHRLGADTPWGTRGGFDYIIVHGVYSWTPEHVRRRTLELFAELLAPDGVGFLSFNALPGWASRGMIADTMKRFTAGIDDPLDRVNAALGLLTALTAAAPEDDTGWQRRLSLEVAFLRGTPPSYLFHDHLSPDNVAFWVSDVIADLGRHGLDWIGDADPSLHRRLTPEALASIRNLAPDRTAAEHLLDMAGYRTFRRLLLTRAGKALVPVPDDLDPRLPAPATAPSSDLARPEVCRVVRAQLARGHERLVSLRHEAVAMRSTTRAVAVLADGTRTRGDLCALVPGVDDALADLRRLDLLVPGVPREAAA
ncbi:MAG: class I SAM-dependent methyltransferase [Myxococcota bacterium]